MNKDELQKIIDQLESVNLKDEAYFGIFQYGGEQDESYIKANKQGLELFAINILKAARDSQDIINDTKKSIIPLDYQEEWIDGDTLAQYIEPIPETRKQIKTEPHQATWQDKYFAHGCFAVGIIVFVLMIIGLITIFTWIF